MPKANPINTDSWYSWYAHGAEIVAGVIASFFVGLPQAVQILFWLMCLDFWVGVISAIFFEKNAEAAVAAKGIMKKVVIMLLLRGLYLVGGVNDVFAQVGTGAAVAFCVAEVFSLVELAGKCEIQLPPVIIESMAKLRSGQPIEKGR